MLDCGCGDGEITLRVAEMIGTSDVYGVDIDEKALSVAGGKGIKLYKADINLRLPFEDNFFDEIFSNQVIECLKEIFEIRGFKVEGLVGAGYYPFPKPLSSTLSALDPRHSAFIIVKARKPKNERTYQDSEEI
jgi:SAM-dependent methyltransferase